MKTTLTTRRSPNRVPESKKEIRCRNDGRVEGCHGIVDQSDPDQKAYGRCRPCLRKLLGG
jgi:hypothetical protein